MEIRKREELKLKIGKLTDQKSEKNLEIIPAEIQIKSHGIRKKKKKKLEGRKS